MEADFRIPKDKHQIFSLLSNMTLFKHCFLLHGFVWVFSYVILKNFFFFFCMMSIQHVLFM